MRTAGHLTGFTEIVSSVKPRSRTERLHVLAALYALNAHDAPVTVTEIRNMLALHLGGKVPRALSARLRRWNDAIEPVAGAPLRWRLTAAGLRSIREATGLALTTESAAHDFLSDVGIVCALEHPEFTALAMAIPDGGQWKEIAAPHIPHRYREATLVTKAGTPLRLVGTTSMSMGLTSAAIVTTQLVLMYRPRLVVMVGIAAGTRAGNKQYGDILVADPSVDYNSGKVVDVGGVRDFLPDPYPIGLNTRLRSLLQKYVNAPHVFAEIRNRWKGSKPLSANRLHLGPLGAADQVIDDASRVLEIQKNWRKLIGVEMETYAVYRACNDAPSPKPRFVSFKAVCDFAADKADSWQDYAAHMAAEFAIEFVRAEWELLWPTAPRRQDGGDE